MLLTLGREARGGSLLITERRLGFLPHRFNVQLAPWSLPLEQLRGVRTEGSRLLVLDTDPPLPLHQTAIAWRTDGQALAAIAAWA